tara:strand:+ start:931 stop:1119 length:189 start_codon:yes stop_codon:yes gene_type:complete
MIFSKIYINLDACEDEIIVQPEGAEEISYERISILDLLKGDFTVLAAFPPRYHEKLIRIKIE